MDELPPKDSMFWMRNRLSTYTYWPFESTAPCNSESMAAAGFFATGGKDEPDSVECFMCNKPMDGWEESDNPWDEHVKHQKNCKYILLNKPDELTWTVEDLYNLAKEYYLKEFEFTMKKYVSNRIKEFDNLRDRIPSIVRNNFKNKKSNC
ncbi:baculoviral IAP repeat-containing protein 5-like [Microplitis mediator]|uniref:baculoviral IAP repeat-containing protein 5-like n=1 Tax=Microplitis mediator TaxID=375433 RepID=UPI0025555F4F|nr:baculoviral IAP repeat-containing protein 5-like [Microplitis mediator]